jgi:hypothetical protein
LSDYDLAELQDYIDDRRNLGTFADEWSMEYSRVNGRIKRVPLILFKYLNTERTYISALRERYDVRFQYDLSVFELELPDIDEFDVGERYRPDIVRRAIESQRNSDVLDPNHLKILLDDLGRVATFTYRILSQRRVRPEAIQVLFRQGGDVKSLAVQKISDIQSPEVLMTLIHSHLTESIRDMLTPETGSKAVTEWARSNFIFEIQAQVVNPMMTRLETSIV